MQPSHADHADQADNGTLAELVLELRRLPGVFAVGLRRGRGRLQVDLIVRDGSDQTRVRKLAEMLALICDDDPSITVRTASDLYTRAPVD
jgi:hypothetical protein